MQTNWCYHTVGIFSSTVVFSVDRLLFSSELSWFAISSTVIFFNPDNEFNQPDRNSLSSAEAEIYSQRSAALIIIFMVPAEEWLNVLSLVHRCSSCDATNHPVTQCNLCSSQQTVGASSSKPKQYSSHWSLGHHYHQRLIRELIFSCMAFNMVFMFLTFPYWCHLHLIITNLLITILTSLTVIFHGIFKPCILLTLRFSCHPHL